MRLDLPDRLSGTYHYRLNGQATDITETFELTRQDEGSFALSGIRRSDGSPSLAVEGILSEGRLLYSNFWWVTEHETVQTLYQRTDQWRWDGKPIESAENADLLFGLLRVFTGPLLAAIHAGGGTARVISPKLAVDDPLVFSPLFSERTVEQAADGSVLFSGGPYQSVSRCWVDDHGLLARYQWSQPEVGDWLVERQDHG